jgi:hypothetical protein
MLGFIPFFVHSFKAALTVGVVALLAMPHSRHFLTLCAAAAVESVRYEACVCLQHPEHNAG